MKATFDGPWLGLLEIMIKNFFLRLITLGFYHPWARVNVRRFMWRHYSIEGERFEFTGSGRELFLGLVTLIWIGLVVASVAYLVRYFDPDIGRIFQSVVGIVYAFAIPYFVYSARRYLLSRTTWKGIRFGLSRVRREYIVAFLIGAFVTVISLGLAHPWAKFRNHKILMNATMYGGLPFVYEGRVGDYYKMYLKLWLLLPLTLGLYYAWFSAAKTRYDFANTKFTDATLQMDVRGRDLLNIYFITIIISSITFGLGLAWANVYKAKYLASKFSLTGDIPFDMIQQMAPEADAMADSAVDYLDLDLGW